ncbi:MAG: DUF4340 domain-containing protein [Candidatus Delongbacteria bacterium]|nr:DUF4340 domain-containing protein [Candidatus Delongbacteria bacterium]
MSKKTFYLIGLLAVLLLLIFLPDMIPEDRGYPVTLGVIDTAAVTRIEVIASDEQLLLEKEGGALVMRQPLDLPLDNYQADRLLAALLNLKVSALTTQKEAQFARYQLTDTLGIQVKVTAGDQVVADFLLGKESSDYQHSYARLTGTNQVLQLSRNLTSTFKQKASNLFRRELFNIDPAELMLVAVRDPLDSNGNLTLNVAEGNLFTDPRGNTFPADSATVQNYLRQIGRLRASAVVMPEEERDAQLAHLMLTVELKAAREKLELEFYQDPDNEEQRILVLPKYPYRFRVQKYQMDKFRKSAEDFLGEEE